MNSKFSVSSSKCCGCEKNYSITSKSWHIFEESLFSNVPWRHVYSIFYYMRRIGFEVNLHGQPIKIAPRFRGIAVLLRYFKDLKAATNFWMKRNKTIFQLFFAPDTHTHTNSLSLFITHTQMQRFFTGGPRRWF